MNVRKEEMFVLAKDDIWYGDKSTITHYSEPSNLGQRKTYATDLLPRTWHTNVIIYLDVP